MMSRRKTIAAFIGACTAAALAVIVFTAPALAGPTITITKTVCSGGGTKYCYSPEAAVGAVGVPVEWVNNDIVTHNVVQCPNSSICPGSPAPTGGWACGTLSVVHGSSNQCTFSTPGTYYYYCSLHGWSAMHGKITITGSGPTPTPRPTPTPTARPTPTPSHSSGPTPTPKGTAPPTAVGATPTPVGATTAPGQTPTAPTSAGSTPTASSSGFATPTATTIVPVGTTPSGSGGSGGSGFPIVIVIIAAVVVIGGGGAAAVLIRRRSVAPPIP